jgi:16S rRNA (guanine527-N7)-methyltransferase
MPGAEDGDHSPTLLHELLREARAQGFLGPGPLEPQIRHAQGFTHAVRHLTLDGQARLVDLGSGGGLPGLVVAVECPDASLVLLEAHGRRAAFLRQAVERLHIESRVGVLEERAEVAGREPAWRETFDGVLARSFGRPAVLAECAAPLLKVGGWLLVSEPPRSGNAHGGDVRWPAEPLRELGMEPAEVVHEEFEYRTLRQMQPCPERFPRRNGVPAKKPLF